MPPSVGAAPAYASAHHRRPQHLLDAGGAGRQHDQAVEAERGAAGRRHVREGGQEVLVDRIALAVDALLLRHLRLEAPALPVGIGELAEGVGELDAAGIELEALGDARVGRLGPRQRGELGAGYSHRMVARPLPSRGSILLDQHAAEDVGPGVVVGHADAGAPSAAAASASRLTRAVLERRQQIDAGVAVEGLGDRDVLRLGERVCDSAAEAQTCAVPAASAAMPQQLRAILHQPLVGLAARDTTPAW